MVTGLIQASLVDSQQHWAVDNWDTAVYSYKANHPTAKVINATCGAFLQHVVESNKSGHQLYCDAATAAAASKIRSELIPVIGSIDIIVAGPPCQVLLMLLFSCTHAQRMPCLLSCTNVEFSCSNAS